MSLKIYGPVRSRTMRTLWMAHELGLDFEHETGFDANGATAELAALNSMRQVPVIVDDDMALSESMAINLYLAKKHGKLAPATLADEAQTLRWCFWVSTAVEKTLLDVLLNSRGLMGRKQDTAAATAGIKAMQKPFEALNDALAGCDYLVGDVFSVADLNVASVFSWAVLAGIDFAEHPNIAAWLQRCLGREAAVQAQG